MVKATVTEKVMLTVEPGSTVIVADDQYLYAQHCLKKDEIKGKKTKTTKSTTKEK